MPKFTVTIEETVSDDFEIEADNAEDALLAAEQSYKQGELVLEPGNLIFKQMACKPENSDEYCSDWREF
jgi:hypothetical protein